MANTQLQDEISYMKQMAEDGRKAPIAGGIIGVWWGDLTFVMLLVHWATLTDRLPLAIHNIGWVWLIYGVIGSIGTYVLVKKGENSPGANSVNSQVGGIAWMLSSFGILTFTIGSVIATSGFDLPLWLFNVILPVALICYGIVIGVIGTLTMNRKSGVVSGLSFLFAIGMFPFLLVPRFT